jgi:hypothetical protein
MSRLNRHNALVEKGIDDIEKGRVNRIILICTKNMPCGSRARSAFPLVKHSDELSTIPLSHCVSYRNGNVIAMSGHSPVDHPASLPGMTSSQVGQVEGRPEAPRGQGWTPGRGGEAPHCNGILLPSCTKFTKASFFTAPILSMYCVSPVGNQWGVFYAS